MRPNDRFDPLVLRVGQVGIARRGVHEGHDERVGPGLVEPFRAGVRPPLELKQARNLPLQTCQFPKSLVDRRLRRPRLPLEEHHMLDTFGRLISR
jgi:hypothetical protein